MSTADTPGEHPASPRKRLEAWREGVIPKSRDLTGGAMLAAAVLAITLWGQNLVDSVAAIAITCWSQSPVGTNGHGPDWQQAWSVLTPLGMMGGTILFVAVAIELLQTGGFFQPARLAPDLSRINPLRGLSQSGWGGWLARLAGGLLRLAVVAMLAAWAAWWAWPTQGFSPLGLPSLVLSMLTAAAIGVVVLGAADYAFRLWRHEVRLRMTDQELRDEAKDAGAPQHTARAIGQVPEIRPAGDATDNSPNRSRAGASLPSEPAGARIPADGPSQPPQ